MVDGLHALFRTTAKEINLTTVEPRLIGLGIHDVGLNLANGMECAVIDTGIHLHTAGINHRTEQRILLHHLTQQDRHTEQLQGGHTDELEIAGITDTLGHRHADAQSSIRARTATDSDGVERNGMIVSERQRFVDKCP